MLVIKANDLEAVLANVNAVPYDGILSLSNSSVSRLDRTCSEAQPQNLLDLSGHIATDRSEGHHCDVVLSGDKAFLFYFTHQKSEDFDPGLQNSAQRSVLQVSELEKAGETITVDRDK